MLICAALPQSAAAADWPMWRYDAGRTASSPEELPAQLHPQWIRQYSQREPVWDDPLNQDLMPLDRVFEPVVLGNTLYMGFNDRDKVVALDIRTGTQRWAFYADGPVRLPLAGKGNRLYFTSDDGYLYCLAADTGALLWKFRGGPAGRKILGNKRLISTWPARGGVVLYEDAVYFAASIWPFMGTFIYALDAETGKVIWRNEGTGTDYQLQPHNSPAFAGVAPQGAMVALANKLLVSGGRSVPACYDRRTGKLLYYHLAANNKTGGAFVAADERRFFNHYRDRDTDLYDTETGKMVARKVGRYPVLSEEAYYTSGDSITIRDPRDPSKPQFTLKVDATGDLIRAGSRLYAAGNGQITAVDLLANSPGLKTAWVRKVNGKVERLIAANGMLFAVTLDGKLIAFGKESRPVRTHVAKAVPPQIPPLAAQQARAILARTGAKNGYALMYGAGTGNLLAALARASDLDIVAVEPRAERVAALRRRFDAAGLLGKRIHLLQGTPDTFEPPPYMASLIVLADGSQRWQNDDSLKKMVRSVRPYGGKIWLPATAARPAFVKRVLGSGDGPKLTARTLASGAVVSKDGPLPKSSNWTHQYGNVANTVKSDDDLVKLPLGVLWFGGVSNLDVLPRHGHGPPEQIVDGRLVIEGVDGISARDVYTGRLLWKAPLDRSHTFGLYFDQTHQPEIPLKVITNQQHIPGANARGTNFIATSDWVYVIQGSRCHVLDMATGEKKKVFSLPAENGAEPPQWGYIGVSGNLLIAGRDFVPFATAFPETAPISEAKTGDSSQHQQKKASVSAGYDVTSSRALVIMDRQSGSTKWTLKARYGFIHNAITASDKVLYCLDKLPPALEKRIQRRGRELPANYRMLALDLETGRVLWERNTGVFGSWLSYSQEHDRILQATRPSRDMVTDEPGERMAVYVASSGKLVWDKPVKYNNPPILYHDEIITDNAAYKLATGERKLSADRLTGEDMPWSYSRGYGCNYNIASEHLLSFRSAAAGFYDLLADSGTGNLGGFKSGCTSNLIAAGGVLNAPDYTRTCQCSYQNQTSLAFIHMPELEYWTTNDFKWNGKRVRRIGINLNAPGDRVAADGTLWVDFPSVGGKSPDLPIQFDAAQTRAVRRHALSLQPNGYEWVAASGFAGPLKLEITLAEKAADTAAYTVKLHFAEIEDKKPGERLFHVRLQDREVLRSFDIAREAGGADKPIVKTFTGIPVKDTLNLECLPASPEAGSPPLLSGIEVIVEN
ncbi:MAG: PQQ-binding-like beta-propeller repeat protein [Bryobacteraceae bacterium]